jgi:hypothetical protein
VSEVLRLHGLGATVEVRCAGRAAPEFADAMRDAWSRCLAPGDAGSDETPVAEQVVIRLESDTDFPHQLQVSTQRITRSLIAARSGQLLMLHAGAVSNPTTGDSLVYVAPGGTGKTTLSRLLGGRFGYLTDETVGIDKNGRILPYPKPLSVRRPDGGALKDEVSPDALGLLPSPASPRVGRIILLDRRPELRGTQLEEIPLMDALFDLVQQASYLSSLPRPLHALADLVDRTAPVIRASYSEASDSQNDLAALVGGLE